MDHSAHNKIVSFIWSTADDCLRDVFVQGKYRDIILESFTATMRGFKSQIQTLQTLCSPLIAHELTGKIAIPVATV